MSYGGSNSGGTSYTSPQSISMGEKLGTRVTRPSEFMVFRQTYSLPSCPYFIERWQPSESALCPRRKKTL